MLYFSLPNFFEAEIINEYLINLNIEKPDIFKASVQFNSVRGNFPFNYWSGGYNNMQGTLVKYHDINSLLQHVHVPVRFCCDNILLQKEDYYDAFNHIILSGNENGNNIIEISNLELLDFLKAKYTNYDYIFSGEADLITSFTPEIINSIIEHDVFKLVNLPAHWSFDKSFLQQINKRTKLEITVNSSCPFNCEKFNYCAINNHKQQYDYCAQSEKRNCKLIKSKLCHILPIEQLVAEYVPLGINHFCFSSFMDNFNLREVVNFYVQYFIKPEYQLQAFSEILKVVEEKGVKTNG